MGDSVQSEENKKVMIYKITHDFENTYSLLIEPSELFSKMPGYRPRFKAKALANQWVEPEASYFASANFSGETGAIPDVSTWRLGQLVLNTKAYDSLKDCLEPSGEFLPISVGRSVFYIFNPLYIIPDTAINLDNAVDVIESGVHLGKNNVSFDEEFLKKERVCVFKTNTDHLVYSYCTEGFRNIYDSSDFKGLNFE
jgi:hypothetical protein